MRSSSYPPQNDFPDFSLIDKKQTDQKEDTQQRYHDFRPRKTDWPQRVAFALQLQTACCAGCCQFISDFQAPHQQSWN
eukprot:4750187-Prorocentrum_lima.AAC.1